MIQKDGTSTRNEIGVRRTIRRTDGSSMSPTSFLGLPYRAPFLILSSMPRRFLRLAFGTDSCREIQQAVEKRTDRNVCPTECPGFGPATVAQTFLSVQWLPVTVAQTFLSVPNCLRLANQTRRRGRRACDRYGRPAILYVPSKSSVPCFLSSASGFLRSGARFGRSARRRVRYGRSNLEVSAFNEHD
jgi:hypothetical protein